MKSEFIDRVLKQRVVDTAKYRYVAKVRDGMQYIARLPIPDLGTTNAIDGWTVIWTEKQ